MDSDLKDFLNREKREASYDAIARFLKETRTDEHGIPYVNLPRAEVLEIIEVQDRVIVRVDNVTTVEIDSDGKALLPPKPTNSPSTERKQINKVFRFIELCARILPPSARKHSFEPAYFDLKADFLRDRKRFKGKIERRWLLLAFGFNVGLMGVQSVWAMCSQQAQKAFCAVIGSVIASFRMR